MRGHSFTVWVCVRQALVTGRCAPASPGLARGLSLSTHLSIYLSRFPKVVGPCLQTASGVRRTRRLPSRKQARPSE